MKGRFIQRYGVPSAGAPAATAPQVNAIAAYSEIVRVTVPSEATQGARRKNPTTTKSVKAAFARSTTAIPLMNEMVCEVQPSGGPAKGKGGRADLGTSWYRPLRSRCAAWKTPYQTTSTLEALLYGSESEINVSTYLPRPTDRRSAASDSADSST